MNITIYSTPTCPHCLLAKRYLQEKNVSFSEIDVAENSQKAEEMINISGQMGVPVIKIDDKVIVGFDKHELDKALEK